MMKTYKLKLMLILFVGSMIFVSCRDSFLDQTPKGELIEGQITSQKGVEFLLVGAYGMLNGGAGGTWGHYASGPSQWVFGELPSDNLHKGSEPNDQPQMMDIERYVVNSSNDNLEALWQNAYEGINRCNQTLRMLKSVQEEDDKFDDDRAKEIEAEAKFLRGHFYFFLWRVFKNIPYVNEDMTTEEAAEAKNDVDVLPMIEDDFKFAVDNLTDSKPLGDVGRVDLKAAKSYLGKLYLYEERFDEAFPLFDDVINSMGDLESMDFTENFDINRENGEEVIFTVEHAINPDGSGDNANIGDMLGGLYGTAPVNCCGFQQPSIDLVNAFKVDEDGLPLLDNSYRDDPYVSDLGLTGSDKDNYVVDNTISFDPRLDYTVGRRGVPFHDWGPMAGDNWIRDPASAGPFVGYKHLIDLADLTGNVSSDANYVTGLNVNIIRLADVYLMAAECAVRGNTVKDLNYALEKVNKIRSRAKNIPHKEVNGVEVADYNVEPYPSFADEAYALKAIQFERRLELALEGSRFFDLRRWGIAQQVLNDYIGFESGFLGVYSSAQMTDQALFFPIPQDEIDRSNGNLTQN